MELLFLTPAGRIIRDENSGKFSYIDIFEQIVIPKDAPSIVPQFFAVGGRISGVPEGQADIEVSIIHQEDEKTPIDKSKLSGPVKKGDLDIAAYFGPTPITKEGRYFFKVKFGDIQLEDKNKFYFDVVRQK